LLIKPPQPHDVHDVVDSRTMRDVFHANISHLCAHPVTSSLNSANKRFVRVLTKTKIIKITMQRIIIGSPW
jgi:hypothetical protein